MKITIDTNILRDIVEPSRPKHRAGLDLVALQEEGKISIQVTTRLDVDVPDGELRACINKLTILDPRLAPALWRVGYTAIENGDHIAGEVEAAEADDILDQLFPCSSPSGKHHSQRCADVDHLIAHRNSGASFFITSEKAMIQNATHLVRRFGIHVLSPESFLAERPWEREPSPAD